MPRAGRARWWTRSWPGRLARRLRNTPTRSPRSQRQDVGLRLFNNVAVAARHAFDARGARRVFIFDWDLHHGDGTNDIFRSSDAVLFASIHQTMLPAVDPVGASARPD